MNTTGLLSGLLLHGLTEHYNRRGRRSAERTKQEEQRRLAEQKEADIKRVTDWGIETFPNEPHIAQEIVAKAMGAASPMAVRTAASKIKLGEDELTQKGRAQKHREKVDKRRLDRQRDVDLIMQGFKADELAIKKQAAEARGTRATAGGRGSDTLQRIMRIRQAISEGQKEALDDAGNTIGTVYPPEYLEVLKESERQLFRQLQEEEGLFADTPESNEKRNLLERFDKFLGGIFDSYNERIRKTIGVDASVAKQMEGEAQRKEAVKKKKKKEEATRVRPVGTSEHYLPFGPSYDRTGLLR